MAVSLLLLVLMIQSNPSWALKEQECSTHDGYARDLPKDGQAFYMETDRNTGRWHYSTPDKWIQKDYLPKDKLIDAPNNWPRWIFHECGERNGYDLVCIESGRYADYWSYMSGWNLGISYSSSPRGSDWTWTHWYVKSMYSDGYVFLCTYDDSPDDPENCNYGWGGYMYIPPTCAGWERLQCCNVECEKQYTQGIIRTDSTSTTVSISSEMSASIEAGLTEVITAGVGGSFSASLSTTISRSVSETQSQTTTITIKPGHCLWVEFLTYGNYQLKRENVKMCPGYSLCYN